MEKGVYIMSEKKSVTETRIVEDPENIRRNFLKKFGKYAATVPAVSFPLSLRWLCCAQGCCTLE